jgi:ubiquinone/menaquinone biosynthesis C-methylase UbiE
METSNFRKHTSKNPFRRWLVNNFYEVLEKEVGKMGAGSVLDAGCGEGFSLDRLRKAGLGKDLIGIDFSKKAIAIGQKLFPDLAIKEGDIYGLDFKDNSFDLVLCTEVLEHLEDPQRALKELIRVSKKYLLLSVPNEPFFSLASLIQGKNIKRWGNTADHLNQWSSGKFVNLLKKEKVKVLKVLKPFPFTLVTAEKV